MTTIDSPAGDAAAESPGLDRALATGAAWFTSSDHKKIGRLFVGGGLLALLATVVVNALIGWERVDGGDAAFDADAWMQLLTSQRVGLVFGGALPLALGLAIAVTPLQLGARALAFPRLAALGFWMWLGGLVLAVVALADNGGPGGGNGDMVGLFLVGHAVMAIGLAGAGGALATSVLTTRAPGMTMRRVPLFSWSSLVFGIGLVLVMPVLLGTLIYLFVDHRSGTRQAFGANDGILTWVGWVFTQPTTFLFAIPAVGVFAELVSAAFGRRTPLRGVAFAGIALVGVSAFAGVTQQNRFEVPWAGSGLSISDGDDFGDKVSDVLPWAFFHLLPLLGAALVLLIALLVAAPPRDGSDRRFSFGPGLLFGFLGFGMVLTGIAGAAIEPILDLGLVGTVFDEGALVYVVYGSALALVGGALHWAPKLWGRTVDAKKTAPLALLGFAGTVLAALPLFIAGFLDQPAGLAYDDDDLQIWNVIAFVGHLLMGLTLLAVVGLLLQSARGADDADTPDDPYDGQTIEWATTSPAPTDNFVDLPTITSAEPLLDLKTANATTNATTGSDA